ncbi:two-component system sensor histidine kinase YesM [Paenibacillus endophyticus]|uniref:histidine kinase n=1 Tax=Paenibacillus endophyticus TaxID=1294268 RepID=A0A7W5C8J5_9BACL|nr:sensor histidine kinase [Paenibacillus endophyticus]MBB3152992.1 two-component system sensor histidine kinase YesM [Paenibacillus endophyticus]
MFYSLKSRLIAIFVLLFVLSFVTLSFLLFNQSRSIIRSYIESSALEKMDEYGSYIDMVQTQIYDLASIVFNSDITNSWNAIASDPSATDGERNLAHFHMSQFLTQTTNSYSSVSSVAIYRQEGLWVSSGNFVVTNPSFLQEDWYNNFKNKEEYWISAHTDAAELRNNNKHPVVSMLMPIGSYEPSLTKSVMKINVSADYFLEPLGRIHLGESGTIYLLDQNGKPMLSQADYETRSDMLAQVQEIRQGWRKQGVLYMNNAQGEKEILVYKKLAQTNWMLVGFVSEDDLYAQLFRLRSSIWIVASILLLLSLVLASWLSHGITKPLSRLVLAMRHIQRGDFANAESRLLPQRSVRNEVGFATETFRSMVHQLREHIKTEFELKLLRQQAEYKALLMQINPHFLFNTLELMSSLAMQKRTEDTVQVIESLGKMMRFSLKMDDDLIRLEEELLYVDYYISILRIRFGERLCISMEKEGNLERLSVVKFIFQPLIENAVKYSAAYRQEAKVHISVRHAEGKVHLVVSDNGPGFTPEKKRQVLESSTTAQLDQILTSRSSQIGLGNVLSRCRLYYESLFEVRIDSSSEEGTSIELILPAQEVNGHVPSIDRG